MPVSGLAASASTAKLEACASAAASCADQQLEIGGIPRRLEFAFPSAGHTDIVDIACDVAPSRFGPASQLSP